jgi:predicted HAD superfamily Cof-like phosphohydrolase
MSDAARMIEEFHRAVGLEPGHALDGSKNLFRSKLHQEENRELLVELYAHNLAGIAKELADVLYIAYGTAYFLGIDIDAVLDAVHQSNMTKADPATGKFRQDEFGKVMKGPNYAEPDIAAVLAAEPGWSSPDTVCGVRLSPTPRGGRK